MLTRVNSIRMSVEADIVGRIQAAGYRVCCGACLGPKGRPIVWLGVMHGADVTHRVEGDTSLIRTRRLARALGINTGDLEHAQTAPRRGYGALLSIVRSLW